MPEHFPDNGEAMRHLLNNRPEKDFGGLTFNEMHRLIYETYEPDSPLKINSAISEQTLDRLPFFRLTEEFLKILQRDGNIKLTPLGALSKKTLVELYAPRFIVEKLIEEGIYKLTREIDTAVLSALRHNTMLSGLIRKFNGRLCLTKEGSKLLTARDRNKLFQKILLTYTDKLPWSSGGTC